MSDWNMFSDEVARERKMLRDYGRSAPRAADSFKAQALRELSRRLNADDDISDLRRTVDMAVNLGEALESSGVQLDDYARKCLAAFWRACGRTAE